MTTDSTSATEATRRDASACNEGLGVPRGRWPAEYRAPLRELVATMVGLRNAEERERRPPCVKCGAETPEQAETMCKPVDCDCPGCRLWPDA